MLVREQQTTTTNFFVIGQHRSGTAVVQSALNNTRGVVCHLNLLHEDEAVRRACHEDYYGKSSAPERFPEWFSPLVTGRPATNYLASAVFNHPLCAERAVGVRLTYDCMARHDLYELLTGQRQRVHVVHVRRNPVACFVSLKQAQRSKCWQMYTNKNHSGALNGTATRSPLPIRLDVAELIDFVRCHEAAAGRLRQLRQSISCLDVDYKRLLQRELDVLHRLGCFLGCNEPVALPTTARLSQCGDLAQRISNWAELGKVAALRDYLGDAI